MAAIPPGRAKPLPTIPEFYQGRKVLVTGGSCLLGRILVEKLLRSCPDVHTIYLLLDPKLKTIHDLTTTALFDKLRRENPSSFRKLVAVDGSLEEVGLGLSPGDRELLQNNISVVFNLDGGVQPEDQRLREAVIVNVRGTRDVVDLALGMKKLKAFIHMSSAFSHFDKSEVFEEIYPAPGDWKAIIKIVENDENETILDFLTPKLVGKLPNAYTYSKALAEHVVHDVKDKLPLVVVRPSEVVSPVNEPFIGWVDSLEGRMTQWINCYTTISSVIYANPHQIRDYVPADLAAKSFIFIAWQRALSTTNYNMSLDSDVLPVYNCCSLQKPTEEIELLDKVAIITENVPTVHTTWYPRFRLTTCWYFYYIATVLFHLIPYTLVDFYTALNRGEPKLVSSLCALFERSKKAKYLINRRNFNFSNVKFMALERFMLASDRRDFQYGMVFELQLQQAGKTLFAARETILKDPKDTLPQARIRMFRLQMADAALRAAIFVTVVWKFYTNQLLRMILAEGWDTVTAISK